MLYAVACRCDYLGVAGPGTTPVVTAEFGGGTFGLELAPALAAAALGPVSTQPGTGGRVCVDVCRIRESATEGKGG